MHVSSLQTRDGHQFEIILDVNFNMATVKIEDINTHQTWEASFDSNFIEDLTRKIGSFKKFPVFISMLESALKKTSPSVNIQLLSCSDLELLRNKKFGLRLSRHQAYSASCLSNSKKFLVLSHVDEFDSTNFPLPLAYLGILDVKLLQEKLRKIELELAIYRNQDSNEVQNREMINLKKEVERLKKEKLEIEESSKYNKKMMEVQNKRFKDDGKLRSVIHNLERDLFTEVAQHKVFIKKKNQENKILTAELQKLRSSEKRLRTKVQKLENELIQLRRHSSRPSSRHSLPLRSRDSSRESKGSVRSVRSQQTYPGNRRHERLSLPPPRHRSCSGERSPNVFRRSFASDYTMKSSPSGSHRSRFDPTAYVMEMKQKRLNVQQKRQSTQSTIATIESKKSKSLPLNQSWSDHDTRGSRHSRVYSSPESVNDPDARDSKRIYPGGNKSTNLKRVENDFETEELSSEIEPGVSEINARLMRLKQFMEEL